MLRSRFGFRPPARCTRWSSRPPLPALGPGALHRRADGRRHEQAGASTRLPRQPRQGRRRRGQLHPQPGGGRDQHRHAVQGAARPGHRPVLGLDRRADPPGRRPQRQPARHVDQVPPGHGGEMDVVANSLPFFPVATGEEFRDLLLAVAASGPEPPQPTKAEQFVAAHPAAAAAGGTAWHPVQPRPRELQRRRRLHLRRRRRQQAAVPLPVRAGRRRRPPVARQRRRSGRPTS